MKSLPNLQNIAAVLFVSEKKSVNVYDIHVTQYFKNDHKHMKTTFFNVFKFLQNISSDIALYTLMNIPLQ
jgi:hypothetical protein